MGKKIKLILSSKTRNYCVFGVRIFRRHWHLGQEGIRQANPTCRPSSASVLHSRQLVQRQPFVFEEVQVLFVRSPQFAAFAVALPHQHGEIVSVRTKLLSNEDILKETTKINQISLKPTKLIIQYINQKFDVSINLCSVNIMKKPKVFALLNQSIKTKLLCLQMKATTKKVKFKKGKKEKKREGSQ